MPSRPPLDTIAIMKRDEKNGKPYLYGRTIHAIPQGCRVHLTKLEDGNFALHVVDGWPRKISDNPRDLASLFTDYDGSDDNDKQ